MNQHSSPDTSFSSSQSISAEAISRRAYEIWEREGRPEGQDLRHWLQAEQELGVRHSEERQNETPASSPEAARPTTDTRPLQTQSPRPAPAAGRDAKRAGAEKTNGNGQNAAKRKPANAPLM